MVQVKRTAKAMARQAAEDLRKHESLCLSCHNGDHCRVGAQLIGYVVLMKKQAEIIQQPLDDWLQDGLW